MGAQNRLLQTLIVLVGVGVMLYGLICGVILQSLTVRSRAGVAVGTTTGSTAVVEGIGFIALGFVIILLGFNVLRQR